MGFQFNHVGGGTKTRRPITLHMKYNSACVQPNCFLVTEEAGEAEVSLQELQARAHATPSPSSAGARPSPRLASSPRVLAAAARPPLLNPSHPSPPSLTSSPLSPLDPPLQTLNLAP